MNRTIFFLISGFAGVAVAAAACGPSPLTIGCAVFGLAMAVRVGFLAAVDT